MTPLAIAQTAIEAGLDMIAVCDHNSAGNVAAVMEAARRMVLVSGRGLAVLAGMELTTAEEIHILGLFGDTAAAEAAAAEAQATLPVCAVASRRFGEQRVMDAEGNTLRLDNRVLSVGTTFALEDAVSLIHRHGGLVVASHVDRPSYSVTSQLGFFPEEVRFDAIELSPVGLDGGRHREFARLGYPVLASSDSHFLWDIGACRTEVAAEAVTFEELKRALQGEGGRACRCA
jgi:predicted metal-dependent phosphoesterase TrpH